MIIARMEALMKKSKKIPMLVATVIAISETSILAATGIVNAPSGLVLRGEPEKGGSVITTVQDDAKVEVIEKNGEWYKVKYNGQEGYLFAEYVEMEEENNLSEGNQTPPTPPNQEPNHTEEPTQPQEPSVNTQPEVIQVKSSANMYIMPLISSTPIGTIAKGTTVTITKQVTNWSYIVTENTEGWVRTHFIKNEVTRRTTNRGK